MKEVLFALLFMALGAVITHASWVHSWKMYKNGKLEGQGIATARKAVSKGANS